MDKLALLDELATMVHDKKIEVTEDATDAEKMLLDIRRIVHESLSHEVVSDITNRFTHFYAPDFDSWKSLLCSCNDNQDYATVLETYTEEELDSLWQHSHRVSKMDIKALSMQLYATLATFKMYEILTKQKKLPSDPKEYQINQQKILAQMKGLYNIIFEE